MERLIVFSYYCFLAFLWVIGNMKLWPHIGRVWDYNGFLGLLLGVIAVVFNIIMIVLVIEES